VDKRPWINAKTVEPRMSAYVIFQLNVIDQAKLSDYGARALPIVAAHGGRPAATGELTVLHESEKFERGAIFEFPDRASALAWHDSREYQALLSLRGDAMNCSLVLIG
jgi:uncharacterized protein (DUF1330 family)